MFNLRRFVWMLFVGFSKWLLFVLRERLAFWCDCFWHKDAHVELVVVFWGSILKILLNIGNKNGWRVAFILFWWYFLYYSFHIFSFFLSHFFRHFSWTFDDIRFLRSLECALHESEGLMFPWPLKRSEISRGGFPKSSSRRGGVYKYISPVLWFP